MDETIKRELHLAEYFHSLEKPEKALEILDAIDPQALQIPAYYVLRSKCLLAVRHFEEALQYALEAVALEPNNEAYFCQLGEVYKTMLKPNLAEKAYLEALRINPECVGTMGLYALCLIQNGQFKKADECLRYGLSRFPTQEALLIARLPLLAFFSSTKEVQETANRILAINPQNQPVHLFLALYFLFGFKVRRALFHMRQAAELSPQNPELGESIQILEEMTHPLMVPILPVDILGWLFCWMFFLGALALLVQLNFLFQANCLIGLWVVYLIYCSTIPGVLEKLRNKDN